MITIQDQVTACNLIDLIDELPPEIAEAYEPTQEDFEWMRAADLDGFIARDLSFPDWVDEQSRQAAILGDDRHEWLGQSLSRLAQLVRWTGATTPEEHEERMEVYERELREKYYADGYRAAMERGDE